MGMIDHYLGSPKSLIGTKADQNSIHRTSDKPELPVVKKKDKKKKKDPFVAIVFISLQSILIN